MWNISTKVIGTYKAVTNVITGEIALVGRYGEIWLNEGSNNVNQSFKVVIISPQAAKKLGHKLHKGSEIVLSFPLAKLDYIAKLISVRPSLGEQCHMANRFHNNLISTDTNFEYNKRLLK